MSPLIQWRAGLRVSEALSLDAGDLSLDTELPTVHVRPGVRGAWAKERVATEEGEPCLDTRVFRLSRFTGSMTTVIPAKAGMTVVECGNDI